MNPLRTSTLLLLIGCARTTLDELPTIDPTTKAVRAAADAMAAVPGYRVVSTDGTSLWLDDPAHGPVALMGTRGTLRAAAMQQSVMLLATDLELLAYRGIIGASPLSDELDGPVLGLEDGADGSVLIETAGGLWRLYRDVLQHLPMALGHATTAADSAVWGTTEGGVESWSRVQGRWTRLQVHEGSAGALALGPDGTAAAAVDGDLHTYDGSRWDQLRLDEDVLYVWGSPTGTGIWVQTESALLWWAQDQLSYVTAAPEAAQIDVDEGGRLVLLDTQGIQRLSAGRSAAITGVRAGQQLSGPTPVVVDAMDPQRVQFVTVTVNDAPVTQVKDTFVLEPTTFVGEGPFIVTAHVTYEDGDIVETSVPVRPAIPESSTWVADVEPLHQAACAQCHEGDTQTLLDTSEAWEVRIEDILDAVRTGRMPLGSPPLSAWDIALIETWRDMGFPRQ